MVSYDIPQHFLGFDCGTKSLGYSLVTYNYPLAKKIKERINLTDCTTISEARERLIELNELSKQLIVMRACGVLDLVPGKKNKDISTVERVRGLINEIRQTINPHVVDLGDVALNVVVEFQMGINAQSRHIESALIALYADCNVIIISPVLKNKIILPDDPKSNQCYFFEANLSNYVANKKHCVYCFTRISKLFEFELPKLSAHKMRDLADSFMQIWGFLRFGNHADAAGKF